MQENTMKPKRILCLICAALCLFFCACSARSGYSAKPGNVDLKEEMNSEVFSPDVPKDSNDTRKIITEIGMQVETKDFDGLIDSVRARVSELGGYIGASNTYTRGGGRYASFTLRIPARAASQVEETIRARADVLSRSENSTDVTLTYIDTQARIDALESEKEALGAILEKAKALEEILQVRDRLTDVIAELEASRTKLKQMDNLIEYTTVNLQISEVEAYRPAEDRSVWEEIGDNIRDGFGNVGYALERLFVFALSSIPYLVRPAALALIILLIVFIVSRSKKKSKK